MNGRKSIDRRDFIKASAVGLAGVGRRSRPARPRGGAGVDTRLGQGQGLPAPGPDRLQGLGHRHRTSQTFPTEVLKAALDAGVNYFDTGEGYGREGPSGASARPSRPGPQVPVHHHQVPLRRPADTAAVAAKLQESLDRLQTDYVDCLMLGPSSAAAVKNEVYHQAIAELKKQARSGSRARQPRQPHAGAGRADGADPARGGRGRPFRRHLLVYNSCRRSRGQGLEAASKKDLGLTIMKSNPLGAISTQERIEQLKKDGQPIDERLQKSMDQMEEQAKQAQDFLKKHNAVTPAEVKAGALSSSWPTRASTPSTWPSTPSTRPELPGPVRPRLGERDRVLLASYESECGPLYCRHAAASASRPARAGPVNTIMPLQPLFRGQAARSTPSRNTPDWRRPRPTPAGRAPGRAKRPARTASPSGRSSAWRTTAEPCIEG